MSKFNVKFHGVRGSIPSPLCNEELEEKMVRAFQAAEPQNLVDDDSIKSFVQSLPHAGSRYIWWELFLRVYADR